MKITPKQLEQIIKEELSSVREIDRKNPWEDDSIEDVIDAYATDSIVFGHSIGPELQEAVDKIDRDDPEQRKAVYVGLIKAADKARKFVAEGFDGPSALDEEDLDIKDLQANLSGEKDEELEQTLQALAKKIENLEKTLVDMKKTYANSISRNTAVLGRQ
jgi:hypothetical protein